MKNRLRQLHLPDPPSLRHLRIGSRLGIVFSSVVVLMLLGNLLAFWHFQEIRQRVNNVSQVEQRLTAIRRLDNGLLKLMNQLHRAAEMQRGRHFQSEANRLLETFRAETESAGDALDPLPGDTPRQKVILSSLRSILDALPVRIESMTNLAIAGDWTALHARLLNEVDTTDEVVASLLKQTDLDLSDARALLKGDVERAQSRAAQTLVVSGLLSLLVAVLLGVAVTRSITQPLASLSATYRMPEGESGAEGVTRTDELGELSQAFERHKRLEAELQEKNFELERANLAKDRFLAGMSHELRTPLNAVIGFTGTLLMKLAGPLSSEQERQLRIIQSSGRHLLSLINDLLDLARIESGRVEMNIEPVECTVLLKEVATTLRPLAEKKQIAFDVALPSDEVIATTDRRALSQILINLSNNAIKFTDRGSIRLELEQQRVNGTTVTSFAVVDTGLGIRKQDQDKLFQAFSRVNSDLVVTEGTGLGLHLSHRLAQLLGGRILVESEYKKGSRFTLVLEGQRAAAA